MKLKSGLIALVLSVMLVMSSVVSAQDFDFDDCLGLSAEDCALINSASMNTFLVAQSFNMNWGFNFSLTGTDALSQMGMDAGDVTVVIDGSGPVAVDMMGNFPVSFAQTLSILMDVMGESESNEGEARLVDGIFYVFAEDEWTAISLLELMEDPSFAEQFGLPSDLMDEPDPDAALEMMPDIDPALMETLSSLPEIDGFVAYVRAGDVFTFTMDLGALITAAEFNTLLQEIGEMTDDPQVAMMGMMLPMLLSEGIITMSQRVDTTMNIVDRVDLTVNLSVDSGMLTGETGAPPVNINLVFFAELTDINQQFDIVAPEGVTPIPMSGGF